MEFMYHQTYTEFEFAKRKIFDEKFLLAKHKLEEGETGTDNTSEIQAQFHPIFLTSLLNQQTFNGTILITNGSE